MSSDVQIDAEVLETFIVEANEHLGAIEAILLSFEGGGTQDSETLNSLFRSFHTIKGTSEMFGFKHVSDFTHSAETLLVKVRNGEVQLTEDLVEVLLKCKDHIIELMSISEADFGDRQDLSDYGTTLVRLLEELGGGGSSAGSRMSASKEDVSRNVSEVKKSEVKPAAAGPVDWGITLKFKRDLFIHGLDPFPIIRFLRQMGEILKIRTVSDDIPTGSDFDPEKCYLTFHIKFRGDVKESDIRENFEFVQDDCDITIVRLSAGESSRADDEGEVSQMQEISSDSRQETEKSHDGGTAGSRIAEISSRKSEVSVDASRVSKSFRVDSERIDNLINLVSELVMSGAIIGQLSTEKESSELLEASDQLARIVTEIRESTLRLRMVPVGGVFNRFKRVIHDLNRELGKNVFLHLRGAETELDKSVIEQISDPLMHLIRNSLDHGIEDAETRQKRNKPPEGNIYLNAFNEAGDIVIEIQDDGGGLKKDRIFSKAVEKGLVEKNQTMNDSDIYRLIFEPGFSTAQKVTNISGRGVGLDVVKRNIDALGGNVDVRSQEGEGTTFRIKLPLTLATIDGFLVGISGVKYVIPQDTVSECIEFTGSDMGHQTRNIINLRGEILPFVKLREVFLAGRTSETGDSKREFIVVVSQSGKKAGLVVDEIFGGMQSVIKPLGAILGKLKGISGSTILGNGEVAFIMDVHSLITLTEELERSSGK